MISIVIGDKMKNICAWCNKDLGDTEAASAPGHAVSHGICKECLDQFSKDDPDFRSYLNSFDLPILAVDREGRVLIANKKSIELLGKEIEEIENSKGGNAMECAHARLPGGCGNTYHCKTCTIRTSVMETFKTGNSIKKAPAYLDQMQGQEIKKINYLISTEMVNDVVLLRVDEVNIRAC